MYCTVNSYFSEKIEKINLLSVFYKKMYLYCTYIIFNQCNAF